jgi:hypothetical protein
MPGLFAALVDDAGLFPPESLPMPVALARHRADQQGAHAELTHRFLGPASRLAELFSELERRDRLRLGLVVDLDRAELRSALDRLAAEPRVTLAVVEGPAPGSPALALSALPAALAALAEVPTKVPCHVEVPLSGDWPAALAELSAAGRAAKVRCGGPRPELFPSAARLGAFVHRCARHGVSFKATAGLHHALPYREERTGFHHHGFLNLLLAACRAVEGRPEEDVVAALRAADAGALVAEARAVPRGVAKAARRLFVAIGSCSTREPIEDLRALGLRSNNEAPA